MANENTFAQRSSQHAPDDKPFDNLHSLTEQDDSDTDSPRSISSHVNRPVTTMNLIQPYQMKTFDDLCGQIKNDAYDFIFNPAPKKPTDYIQCRLVLENSGLFQRYQLEIELDKDTKPICLLTAEKEHKLIGDSQYLITLDPQFQHTNNLSAELICDNFTGTSYTLYDVNRNLKQQLAIISYETNFLGFNGPRKMQIFLRKCDDQMQPLLDEDEINEYCSEEPNNGFIRLYNKEPDWIAESNVHVLAFEGKNRITEPSIKNFQLISENKNIKQNLMQFGRMSENIYSCDFRYPLSFVQAFSIGLSALETSLFRE